jgi:hypothetical protein
VTPAQAAVIVLISGPADSRVQHRGHHRDQARQDRGQHDQQDLRRLFVLGGGPAAHLGLVRRQEETPGGRDT